MSKKYTPQKKVYATINWSEGKKDGERGRKEVTTNKEHTEYTDEFMSKDELYKEAEELKEKYPLVWIDWDNERGIPLEEEEI